MPLTKDGEKVMTSMKKSYGSDEEAERVFYASINKGKPGSDKWHKKKKEKFKRYQRRQMMGPGEE